MNRHIFSRVPTPILAVIGFTVLALVAFAVLTTGGDGAAPTTGLPPESPSATAQGPSATAASTASITEGSSRPTATAAAHTPTSTSPPTSNSTPTVAAFPSSHPTTGLAPSPIPSPTLTPAPTATPIPPATPTPAPSGLALENEYLRWYTENRALLGQWKALLDEVVLSAAPKDRAWAQSVTTAANGLSTNAYIISLRPAPTARTVTAVSFFQQAMGKWMETAIAANNVATQKASTASVATYLATARAALDLERKALDALPE